MTAPRTPDRAEPPDGTSAAIAVLAITATFSLIWSHVRLLWNDEFLSFYSDAALSLSRVLEIQLHSPISLDPPTYHLLSHMCMNAFGRNGMALRLPALAGFLLLQLCLFVLVRRLAGYRAALVAMLFPLCTASFRYSVEGRPYGLLLGLYAAALLCWYTAAERGPDSARRFRGVWLAGLTVSIALAITSHYFGVLILLPVTAGELARTLVRRRFDWPVVAALAFGLCSVGLIVPFQKALAPYRQHYYTSSVNLHNVSQGYRELFVRYNRWPIGVQHVCAALLLIATLVLLIAAYRVFRRGEQHTDARARTLWIALWAALLTFAALPFCGYLFGRFVTHTMEVRYVIAALVFFAVALALVLAPRLRSTPFFYATISALLTLAAVASITQIQAEGHDSATILANLTVPEQLRQTLTDHPDRRLYTQSLGDFFLDSYYAEPLLRSRMTLLYDEPSEVRYLRHNTNAVTAVNLARFSPLQVAPWPGVATKSTLLLNYHSGWEWIGTDLQANHLPFEDQGRALGGDLLLLNPDAHTGQAHEWR